MRKLRNFKICLPLKPVQFNSIVAVILMSTMFLPDSSFEGQFLFLKLVNHGLIHIMSTKHIFIFIIYVHVMSYDIANFSAQTSFQDLMFLSFYLRMSEEQKCSPAMRTAMSTWPFIIYVTFNIVTPKHYR